MNDIKITASESQWDLEDLIRDTINTIITSLAELKSDVSKRSILETILNKFINRLPKGSYQYNIDTERYTVI